MPKIDFAVKKEDLPKKTILKKLTFVKEKTIDPHTKETYYSKKYLSHEGKARVVLIYIFDVLLLSSIHIFLVYLVNKNFFHSSWMTSLYWGIIPHIPKNRNPHKEKGRKNILSLLLIFFYVQLLWLHCKVVITVGTKSTINTWILHEQKKHGRYY